jgi:tetratricopeptide (TPR) repeat protein
MIGPRALLWTAVLIFFAQTARADDPTASADRLAQSLFDEATALMDQSRFEEACPKFAESQRLSPGGGTLLNLAYCLEKLHKYASAYTAYNEALSASLKDGRKDREISARERIAAVLPKLSRASVKVPPESRLPELEVRFDGTPVREAAWGVAAPVDSGPHEVVATAKGKKPWTSVVQIDEEGTTKEIMVGPFEDLPLAAPPPPPPPVATPKTIEQPESSSNPRRTAAYVVAGVSGAFLVEGIITGVLALSAHDERNTKCAMGCTQAAYDAESRANAFAWAANIGIGAAIVGAGVSAVLFFTSPKSIAQQTTGLVFTGNGIQGRF